MILFPFLQDKAGRAPAFYFPGLSMPFASLASMKQARVLRPIAGSHLSRRRKTESGLPSNTAIRTLIPLPSTSSIHQNFQKTALHFALSLHFLLNMPQICCIFVTSVTKNDLGNPFFLLRWYDYRRIKKVITQVALCVLAADSVVASLRDSEPDCGARILVRSRSGSMNSDWNPVAYRMILA